MSYRILLVDDDKENLNDNKRMLAKAGYTVVTAESGEEAIDILRKSRADFALVLMDSEMPGGMSGPEAIEEIRKIVPSQQIFSFTIHDTTDMSRVCFKSGANDFLYKNANNDVILAEIARACTKYEHALRTINSGNLKPSEKKQFISDTHMTGESDQTYALCEQVRKVAPSEATVMVLGPSGSGKEVVAQAIHKMSHRRSGPFIAINIGGESASLLDSTLFGHKKGSFTGAANDQPGKFQLANGGTIFLDEIGDLSLDLQVKLLRVIDTREITPLGASKTTPINVRIVTATHRNIPEMVKQGTFREDLFFRLNTVILKTTPLRERPADIEPLVGLFTDQVCTANNFRRRFSRDCLEVLKKHVWNGNVRELRSVVEKHLIMASSNEVQPRDLAPELFERQVAPTPTTMDEIDEHVDNIKRDLIVKAVIDSGKNQARAARTLGIAPNRLHYFLNKFGLRDLF